MCSQYVKRLRSTINKIGGWRRGIWSFNDHNNLHLDKEYDIHMNFEDFEDSVNSLKSDLLAILYLLCVSYPMRSELGRRSNHLRPI